MSQRDLIVIGASAGGLESLRWLARALPRDFPAAIVIVMHLAPSRKSKLAELLDAEGGPRAITAAPGQLLAPGVIHVSPPNQHVSITGNHLNVDAGPHENGFRPAIDRLFRTAALERGPRTIGVILSGMRDDGTEGLSLIKRCGGIALAQDPEEALYPSMPASAIANVVVDRVFKLDQLPSLLTQLIAESAPPSPTIEAIMDDNAGPSADEVYVCPECGGVAREVTEAGLVRYRCRVDHVYNAESFVDDHSRGVEDALWAAVNALSERKSLTSRMATRARAAGRINIAERYEQLASDAADRAEAIRKLLLPVAAQDAVPSEQ